MTVAVLPETYSECAGEGGSVHIDKIRSGYGEKVTAAMEGLRSFNEGTLQGEWDILSDAVVTYYFDEATLTPLAAVYSVTTDTNQKINIYQNEEEVGTGKPAGYVKIRIVSTAKNYYFFD